MMNLTMFTWKTQVAQSLDGRPVGVSSKTRVELELPLEEVPKPHHPRQCRPSQQTEEGMQGE